MNNLADAKDIQDAENKEQALRLQQMNDIKTVLDSISGRRLMWRILEKCKTFNSVYDSDGLLMANKAGKQDIGHFLMAEIVEADENLLLRLMKNKKGRDYGN